MKKNISRNPLWPDWYNGKKIDEVQFGRAFLEQWPLKCVNSTLYTLDGPVEDESEIKQRTHTFSCSPTRFRASFVAC